MMSSDTPEIVVMRNRCVGSHSRPLPPDYSGPQTLVEVAVFAYADVATALPVDVGLNLHR